MNDVDDALTIQQIKAQAERIRDPTKGCIICGAQVLDQRRHHAWHQIVG